MVSATPHYLGRKLVVAGLVPRGLEAVVEQVPPGSDLPNRPAFDVFMVLEMSTVQVLLANESWIYCWAGVHFDVLELAPLMIR